VDAFIDASGAPPAVRAGISAVRAGGAVILVGLGASDYPLPIQTIQERELTVTGVFRYTDTWPLAIHLVISGQIDVDSLVTGHYSLDHVEDALNTDRDPNNLKAIVRPGP
jgi:L-iditol 2-dehydrogenase